MSTSPGLKACPKCGADSIFLPLNPAAGYDGKLYGSRSEGFCNSPQCDQLLWYYPRSGRVTRRNVGPTLVEYHDRQRTQFANLRFINIMRRHLDLPSLVEVRDIQLDTAPYKPPSLSLAAQFRGLFVDWYWWIVAVFKSPFFSKLPVDPVDVEALQALKSGDKSINQVRGEQGLDPVESDNAE